MATKAMVAAVRAATVARRSVAAQAATTALAATPTGFAAQLAGEAAGKALGAVREFLAPKQFAIRIENVPVGKKGRSKMKLTEIAIHPTAGGLIAVAIMAALWAKPWEGVKTGLEGAIPGTEQLPTGAVPWWAAVSPVAYAAWLATQGGRT